MHIALREAHGRRTGTPAGLIDPIAQYDHDEGVSVIGGFVYRGSEVGVLRGRYVFGDFIRPPFNPFDVACDGRLFVLKRRVKEKDVTRSIQKLRKKIKLQELQVANEAGRLDACLLGFGQDASDEVYALVNQTGTPFGDTGAVLKIVKK